MRLARWMRGGVGVGVAVGARDIWEGRGRVGMVGMVGRVGRVRSG